MYYVVKVIFPLSLYLSVCLPICLSLCVCLAALQFVYYSVILLFCYSVILLFFYSVILLFCYSVILLFLSVCQHLYLYRNNLIFQKVSEESLGYRRCAGSIIFFATSKSYLWSSDIFLVPIRIVPCGVERREGVRGVLPTPELVAIGVTNFSKIIHKNPLFTFSGLGGGGVEILHTTLYAPVYCYCLMHF